MNLLQNKCVVHDSERGSAVHAEFFLRVPSLRKGVILRCFRGIGHELLFGETDLAAAMRDLRYFPPFGLSLFKVRPPVTAMNLCTRFSQGTNQGGMLYDWFQNEKLLIDPAITIYIVICCYQLKNAIISVPLPGTTF